MKKSIASKKKSPKRATRAAPVKQKLLEASERKRMLKPPSEYSGLVTEFADGWTRHRGELRVAGSTPAQLKSLLRKAERASARERIAIERLEQKLAPLKDTRLRTESEMWRTLLNVYAVAKAQARTNPRIATVFESLARKLSLHGRGATKAPPAAK